MLRLGLIVFSLAGSLSAAAHPCSTPLHLQKDELVLGEAKQLVYPVIDQGQSGACTFVEASEVNTQFFREQGYLGPQERLSIDFYYHLRLADLLQDPKPGWTLRNFPNVDTWLMEAGAFSTDYFALIQRYGLVTETQYTALPKLLHGTRFGSEAYRRRLIAAVHRIRQSRTWAQARAILFEYVGNLDQFHSNLALNEEHFRPKHLMRKYVGHQYLDPPEPLIDAMRATLRAGRPLVIGISVNDEVFEAISRRGHTRGVELKPWREWAHAMLAVKNAVDEYGEYFLVRNSWGKPWGKDGFVKMYLPFLKFNLSDVSQIGK